MESIQVLKVFGLVVDDESLSELPPHLTDKMVADLINGIEVTNDHIKVSKSRTTKLNRCMDGVTGTSKQRQDLINTNLANGLEATSVWLQKHELDITSVNFTIAKVGKKLLETRQGVMKLNAKHEHLVNSVTELANVVEQKTAGLRNYIREVDIRTLAEAQLNRVFDKWSAGGLDSLPLYARVYTVLDLLKNGDFGFYLEFGNSASAYKREMFNNLKDKFQVQLSHGLGIQPKAFRTENARFKLDEVTKSIHILTAPNILSLNYLSDWSTPEIAPNTCLLHTLTGASLQKDLTDLQLHTPNTIRIDRWLDRITEENIVIKGYEHAS